ncbi:MULTISPECIES: ribosomal protein S18-alanine N-acetyltransferase [Roseobacteraceae]|uniref:[Ribosomal protein bS18]-alanine N-acetyltransferase n=1 Tax=Pseudosulfitobacter pseudonitzschiae TaxID=1402135 RepID=A0A221JWY7_9RHOB|nr:MULTISPECIES: ribosomal protein S18-alanine N-acetyltransferase [Roseobacteraceae]ASM71255.1 ribosomal-protein-alanine acetyltransferase [Pseudosulfitobacter pseudonitzschiae]
MTPLHMAHIHAAAFTSARPWSADEFAALLDNPHVFASSQPQGFALVREVAGEAELLTIAVHPDHQGQGIGRVLMVQWMDRVRPTASEAFLEVAADNAPALALYTACGFGQAGLRAAYYPRANAPAVDAVLMRASLG